jgi:hypothetical protein
MDNADFNPTWFYFAPPQIPCRRQASADKAEKKCRSGNRNIIFQQDSVHAEAIARFIAVKKRMPNF